MPVQKHSARRRRSGKPHPKSRRMRSRSAHKATVRYRGVRLLLQEIGNLQADGTYLAEPAKVRSTYKSYRIGNAVLPIAGFIAFLTTLKQAGGNFGTLYDGKFTFVGESEQFALEGLEGDDRAISAHYFTDKAEKARQESSIKPVEFWKSLVYVNEILGASAEIPEVHFKLPLNSLVSILNKHLQAYSFEVVESFTHRIALNRYTLHLKTKTGAMLRVPLHGDKDFAFSYKEKCFHAATTFVLTCTHLTIYFDFGSDPLRMSSWRTE